MRETAKPMDWRGGIRGVATLLGAPTGDLPDICDGDVCLVGLCTDHGTPSVAGSRFLARELRYVSDPAMGWRTGRPPHWLRDLGDLNVFPLDPTRNRAAITRQVRAIVARGGRPLLVGGDLALADALHAGVAAALDAPVVSCRRSMRAGNADWTASSVLVLVVTIDEGTDDAAWPRGQALAALVGGFRPDFGLAGRASVAAVGRQVEQVARWLRGAACH